MKTKATSEQIEQAAMLIAEAMGDNYSDAFRNKQAWVAARGMSGGRFRDVNEPFQADYDEAAGAVFAMSRPEYWYRQGKLEGARLALEAAATVKPANTPSGECETVGQWTRRTLREAIRALDPAKIVGEQ